MNPIQTSVSALLIMCSIFLGFQVDRWWEEKRERATERSYLERLNADVAQDEIALSRRIEYFTAIRAFGAKALEFLAVPESGEGRETELLAAFYLASHAWEFTPARSTFEELKSAGILNIIQDIEVRNAVLVYHLTLNNANYVWKTENYYRRTARSLIPPDVQTLIWEACHELADQAAVQYFIADCKPEIDHTRVKQILEKMIRSPALEENLNFLVANTDVSLILYHEHRLLTREMTEQFSLALVPYD